MAKRFKLGEQAHLEATCTVAGVLRDPSVVVMEITNPNGEESSVSLAAGTVERDSDGVFSFDLPLTQVGQWTVRCATSGDVVGADDVELLVSIS